MLKSLSMEEEKEKLEPKSGKSTTMYIVGGVIILLVLGVGGYLMNKGSEAKNSPEEITETVKPQPQNPESMKGQQFSTTNFYTNAVIIAPGPLSVEAKAVTTGWDIKSRSLADGTTQVDLIPTGSEATEGDTAHSFNLKTGDKLYFVDLNPGDDRGGADNNKNDDIGIVVDANGIIQ